MKKYVKPEIEVIKLRMEERIASAGCSGGRITVEVELGLFDGACGPQDSPEENLGECYDLSDCS